ncbi:Glu-tRNA(Gln) amidotransferase subunit GatD [Halorubrum sp. Atlit-26R]|uniref:Glu-tRNA(Gln) amidotransferase subunit GatD n=1 Tax=Halorubrum sp. Atlit-26R TaxID=2282128 RepID=UPI000EF2035A|nr:Glu-tRNA(Gln) amidotransferase subunit GatD [Halorubrum sp. Atlit-26R]RLM72386.1 Glu-tRNA(Gln) amidotransferase GatDE subunit D [Halorubrum sp. Atlit-26R]
MTESDTERPEVAIINVGGTISASVDYETGAATPQSSAEQIYRTVPEVEDMADLSGTTVCNIQSENIRPRHWNQIGNTIEAELNDGAAGAIIPHGTDVMGHTGAALSFMFQDLSKPIILVGAQRSRDRPSSDIYLNLASAVAAATSNLAEVGVVMHRSTSDESCWLHPGPKVRKCHTSRRDAFQTVNSRPIGEIKGNSVEFLDPDGKADRTDEDVECNDGFEDDVALVKLSPNMSPDRIHHLVDEGYEGIVLEGTGLGHSPEQLDEGIERAITNEIPVVMTSQCLWGRTNMRVYSRGRNLLDLGVFPVGDMLPETAYIKLMWVLDKTKDPERVKEMMQEDLAGEINATSQHDTYLKPQYEGTPFGK